MIQKGKPVHLRLINADEIIGEYVEDTDREVIVSRPMIVTEIEDPNTKSTNVVLSKYVLFNDDDRLSLKKEHIITMTGVIKEIGEFYYNSMEYNSKFLETKIVDNIANVNKNMKSILDQSNESVIVEDEEIPTSVRKVYYYASNTIH